MSHKPSLVLNNLSKKKALFKELKDNVLCEASALLKLIDEPIKVTINIVDNLEDNCAFNDVNTNGYVYYQGHHAFTINVLVSSLEDVKTDGGLTICSLLAHEFAHIRDKLNFLKSDLKFLKDVDKKPRTYKEFLRNVGYDFWTEFYAYRFMFKNFQEVPYSSFLNLVKQYEQLCEEKEKIAPLIIKSGKHDAKIRSYCENAFLFVYLIARFLAGDIYGKRKYYDYAESTKSKPSFKYVDRLVRIIVKRIKPMMNEKHGKRKAYAITNLGYYLMEEFYHKFNMYAIKKNNYFFFAVYDE